MNATQCFLHPRRASQRIAALEDELDEARSDSEALEVSTRSEIGDLRSENADLKLRLESTLFSLKTLTDELLKTRRELDDALERERQGIEVEKAVAMVESKLTEVENMRRNYERRISELKTRLEAANKRLHHRDCAEIPLESPAIDMKRAPTLPDDELNPEGDWLQMLPD